MGPRKGRLVVISGPSGAGKSTVVKQLLRECRVPLRLSVSATTRRPRPGEREGADYHFLSPEAFRQRRRAGEFLECKEVYGKGNWYGTLRGEVDEGLAAGDWVVLEIDVQGALAVVEQVPDAITIFLHPGSMEELERRLRERGTEDEATLRRRLEAARGEFEQRHRYRYEVVNRDKDAAVREICEILQDNGAAANA